MKLSFTKPFLVFAAVLIAGLIAACGGSQPTQTPIVITATPLPTAIVVTSVPVTVIVPVTVTPGAVPTAIPPCSGPPTIQSFVANPANISQGQSTFLQWGLVGNATAVGIDQGIGGVPSPGQAQVTPAQTTTYTMIATGCGGQTQKAVTVTVNAAPTNVPPPTNPPPPTNVPPTATAEACATEITNVAINAPSNPGTILNVTATECYDGSQGEGVNVTATAEDASGAPIEGVTVASVSAGTNKAKDINLSITMLLGAQPPPSTQVELCFQTTTGTKFSCILQPYDMTWQ